MLTMNFLFLLFTLTSNCLSATFGFNFGPGTENYYKNDDSICDDWTERFARNQRTISAKLPPDLHGKWVSESCEIRPGPEYLIRKYQFHKNNTFLAQQFYYTDDSCTTPSYAINAAGKYRFTKPSWVVPGAMNAEYQLTKVAITPYNNHIASSMAHKVNRSCPGFVNRQWRPYRSYQVYSFVEVLQSGSDNTVQVIEDIDCISGLNIVLHELQLIRVEHRKALHKSHQAHGHHIPSHGIRNELFLGDIHTEASQRQYYHPTSFQTPLLRPETSGCHICHIVGKASQRSPPQLHAKVKLPVYMSGIWISHRCETRPYGMFITRRLSFFGYNQTWKGEYQYHSDPKCLRSTFKIVAYGNYEPGNPSIRVQGGTDYNFYVLRAEITPQSIAIVNNLNGQHANTCGKVGSWELNKSQDVSSTKGCHGLGLKVPATEFDIIRMDLDHHGNPMLHLGHVDTNYKNKRFHSPHAGHRKIKRPTSYQTFLVQCKTYPSYADHLHNNVYPQPYQHGGNKSSGSIGIFNYLSAFQVSILITGIFNCYMFYSCS